MNTDQQERAAYQRAVESAKNEIADLRRRAEQAEVDAAALRAEMLHRVQIDAEDTHRLQRYCKALLAELEAARAVIRSLDGIHVGWPPYEAARAAYDAAMKAREG